MLFGDSSSHGFRLLFGLRALGAILRTALHATVHSCGIQCTTYNVVADTWEVFHTTTTNKHNAVFLEVVTFTADVGVYFISIGKADTGHFTHG